MSEVEGYKKRVLDRATLRLLEALANDGPLPFAECSGTVLNHCVLSELAGINGSGPNAEVYLTEKGQEHLRSLLH